MGARSKAEKKPMFLFDAAFESEIRSLRPAAAKGAVIHGNVMDTTPRDCIFHRFECRILHMCPQIFLLRFPVHKHRNGS